MSDRQATPDVMGALMDGPSQQSSPQWKAEEGGHKAIQPEDYQPIELPLNKTVKPESNKAIKQECNKTVLQALNNAVKQESNNELEEDSKEKATFNLSVKVLEELEEKWAEIRKLTRSKQISKTLIVEEALKIAFEEYSIKKQGSELYSRLVNHKAIKQ